jgi:hypothetical protein
MVEALSRDKPAIGQRLRESTLLLSSGHTNGGPEGYRNRAADFSPRFHGTRATYCRLVFFSETSDDKEIETPISRAGRLRRTRRVCC